MKVLGLEFYDGKPADALSEARGLCVFPSGPGLATLKCDARYREALAGADTRFVDSGFLALFWFLLSGERLSRLSGLRFLKAFLEIDDLKNKRILWVHPTPPAQKRNRLFLEFDKKFPAALPTHYCAPLYPAGNAIQDEELLALARKKQPQVIVLNLGSGTQEPLGFYLKKNLAFAPVILCTGGAIDFLTGAQANIPDWADRLFLGWLFRSVFTSRSQAKRMRVSPGWRYLVAWRLLPLLMKYRREMPQ